MTLEEFEEFDQLPPEEKAHIREVSRRTARMWANCGAAQKAVDAENWEWISGWLAGRLGVVASAKWCRATRPKGLSAWSDGSWLMYWKTQLIKADKFEEPGRVMVNDQAVTAILHTGFMHITETDEMRWRLGNEDGFQDADSRRRRLATPGIERVMTSPEPIDRVAGRVVAEGSDE